MAKRLHAWEMTLSQFIDSAKSVRFDRRVQFTGQFSRTRSYGCDYYVYVDVDNLEVINPYTKKYSGRRYKSFHSSVNAAFAKEKAYHYIIEKMKGFI